MSRFYRWARTHGRPPLQVTCWSYNVANIYEERSEPLHQLLDRARAEEGATVVIPELQRPYVWKPNHVTLLIDSLIRGWPFGTLLAWKVKHEDLEVIPHRPFWRTVDRTDDEDSTPVMRKNPPGNFLMVLDGQQRVQSLVLALSGDDAGFKLEDREWYEEVRDERPRSRQKQRHWSKASLCFDLDAFLAGYAKANKLFSVDFRTVLVWAVTDSSDGLSKGRKADAIGPLPLAYASENRGKLIRLSRLWNAAQPNQNLKERDFRQLLEGFFVEQDVPTDKRKPLLEPMGELMTTLRDVKLAKITYLELAPFDETLWSRDDYNDAIVNIFTRLNTAGRTLTREQITFAWLKVNWDAKSTAGKSAAACFEELRDELTTRGLALEMDDLISAVMYVWSVRFNQGKLLTNRDLLRGETLAPIAKDLSTHWAAIHDSLVDGIDAVRDRGLEYGKQGHYSSVNALSVLWAWLSLTRLWADCHPLTTLKKDDYTKLCDKTLAAHIDRWLLCSNWAGRWAGSTASAFFPQYARELNETWDKIKDQGDHTQAHDAFRSQLAGFVNDLETPAVAFVERLSVEGRGKVRAYKNLLWVWHRLTKERWEMSKIPLRIGKAKQSAFDVDHLVSVALWQRKLMTTYDVEEAAGVSAGNDINFLGNTSLLDKSFNISKYDQTLKAFLEQVHEFRDGKKQAFLEDWAAALLITSPLLDPEAASVEAVIDAIADRDTAIRRELIEFVKGQRTRADV